MLNKISNFLQHDSLGPSLAHVILCVRRSLNSTLCAARHTAMQHSAYQHRLHKPLHCMARHLQSRTSTYTVYQFACSSCLKTDRAVQPVQSHASAAPWQCSSSTLHKQTVWSSQGRSSKISTHSSAVPLSYKQGTYFVVPVAHLSSDPNGQHHAQRDLLTGFDHQHTRVSITTSIR